MTSTRDARNYSKGYQQAMADMHALLIERNDRDAAQTWISDNYTNRDIKSDLSPAETVIAKYPRTTPGGGTVTLVSIEDIPLDRRLGPRKHMVGDFGPVEPGASDLS